MKYIFACIWLSLDFDMSSIVEELSDSNDEWIVYGVKIHQMNSIYLLSSLKNSQLKANLFTHRLRFEGY